MSIRHLPYTVLMIVISLSPLLVLMLPSELSYLQSIVLFVMFMMGFSLIAFINSFFLVKIFDNYIPEEDKEDPDDHFPDVPNEITDENTGAQPLFEPTPIFRDEITKPEETSSSEDAESSGIPEEENAGD